MADQQLDRRVETLEQLLADALNLIQRLAQAGEKVPGADHINAGNLVADARNLAERARQSGLKVKRF